MSLFLARKSTNVKLILKTLTSPVIMMEMTIRICIKFFFFVNIHGLLKIKSAELILRIITTAAI